MDGRANTKDRQVEFARAVAIEALGEPQHLGAASENEGAVERREAGGDARTIQAQELVANDVSSPRLGGTRHTVIIP